MIRDNLKLSFAQNVALLKLVGIHPVVVHGGGPQINNMLDKLAIKSEFRQGQRVTDQATMDVVEMVLVGSVNQDIVNQVNQAGAKGVGLSGKDGRLLTARKLSVMVESDQASPEIIDLGNVGEITQVRTDLLHDLIRGGFVPIIAPIGVDEQGRTYNVNADTVAGAVAGALQAKRLLLLTDVPGILDNEKNLIHFAAKPDIQTLIKKGIISGGMIPKVENALKALSAGASKATIVDGRVENCLILELLTDQGIGTQIAP